MLGSLFEWSISQAPEFTKVDSSTFIHLRRNSNGINRGWPWPVIWERALILSTHLNTRQASKSFETTDWSWSYEWNGFLLLFLKGHRKKKNKPSVLLTSYNQLPLQGALLSEWVVVAFSLFRVTSINLPLDWMVWK